jgi:hypothetical protein
MILDAPGQTAPGSVILVLAAAFTAFILQGLEIYRLKKRIKKRGFAELDSYIGYIGLSWWLLLALCIIFYAIGAYYASP